ncbi:hypothetical protein QVD17_09565 [Tagetes erecta]|uniref:NAC domain-containing protein n=1 Tax=Tagetes erecta TaxID=13708 RepID=A0AAD8L0U7_TARER|nr:hypothetical protein QVD17_09565 [Tagetes erecta]
MHTTTTTSSVAKTLHMPIGYRFCPTDEEIIIHYLRPKVLSFPLPATAIMHSQDLLLHHPAHLPGDPKEKRYFFNKQGLSQPASNPAGYWKPVVKNGNTHKLILATGCNHPIGFKKTFVFYEFSDHRKSGSRTSWMLQQFCLLYTLPTNMQEWMVCSIEMKSKNVKKQDQRPVKRLKICEIESVIDDDDDDACSGVTFDGDLSDRKDDEEEEELIS